MFDACFYINMDRSIQRRDRFLAAVAGVDDWPFPVPVRWPGVEEAAPPWWRTGDGAWGCFLAHFALYHHCIARKIERPVIFEDDAVFVEDFGEQVRNFLAAVPEDWHQIYFGGNHFTPPTVVNSAVLRCKGTNCNHAYALRGAGLSAIHELVGRFPGVLTDDNAHIDVMFNTLHVGGHLRSYAPWRWLVGQCANVSERNGYVWTESNYWNIPEEALHKAAEELALC